MYRARSEAIKSSLVSKERLAVTSITVGMLPLPESGDLEAWFFEVARSKGFDNWEAILNAHPLPRVHMLAHPVTKKTDARKHDPDIITSILLLARTNNVGYLPDGPFILSRSRLSRHLKLTQINLSRYYAMD